MDNRSYFVDKMPQCRNVALFKKINLVGKGTYGEVWIAENSETGQKVALKKIRMESEKEGFPITSIREIIILKALNHKNIVRLLEVVIGREETIEMVFEYMQNDLAGLLKHAQYLTDSQIKCIMKQILEGLHFIHKNDILHRDIKPANILISNTGVVKLTDFGLSRIKKQARDLTNHVVTLWYRAPELLLGSKKYDEKIDMWAVGCILGEILVKKPLLKGDNEFLQLGEIWKLCGTPEESWTDVVNLPFWKGFKPKVKSAKSLFNNISLKSWDQHTLDLLDKLLCLNPAERLSTQQALTHKYFWIDPMPSEPKDLAGFNSLYEFTTKKRNNEGNNDNGQQKKPRPEGNDPKSNRNDQRNERALGRFDPKHDKNERDRDDRNNHGYPPNSHHGGYGSNHSNPPHPPHNSHRNEPHRGGNERREHHDHRPPHDTRGHPEGTHHYPNGNQPHHSHGNYNSHHNNGGHHQMHHRNDPSRRVDPPHRNEHHDHRPPHDTRGNHEYRITHDRLNHDNRAPSHHHTNPSVPQHFPNTNHENGHISKPKPHPSNQPVYKLGQSQKTMGEPHQQHHQIPSISSHPNPHPHPSSHPNPLRSSTSSLHPNPNPHPHPSTHPNHLRGHDIRSSGELRSNGVDIRSNGKQIYTKELNYVPHHSSSLQHHTSNGGHPSHMKPSSLSHHPSSQPIMPPKSSHITPHPPKPTVDVPPPPQPNDLPPPPPPSESLPPPPPPSTNIVNNTNSN